MTRAATLDRSVVLDVAAAAALLACLAVGCASSTPGDPCPTSGPCAAPLTCIDVAPGDRRCMAPCAVGVRLCDDGAACLDAPSGARVCWYGGGTPFGHACADPRACEPGTVCVEGACAQACVVGDDRPCESGQRCVGATSEGWCEDAPDGGSADGGSADAG